MAMYPFNCFCVCVTITFDTTLTQTLSMNKALTLIICAWLVAKHLCWGRVHTTMFCPNIFGFKFYSHDCSYAFRPTSYSSFEPNFSLLHYFPGTSILYVTNNIVTVSTQLNHSLINMTVLFLNRAPCFTFNNLSCSWIFNKSKGLFTSTVCDCDLRFKRG